MIRARVPSILLALCSCAFAVRSADIPAAVLEDRIRGGLLGQILGDLNGLPHEMKYISQPGNVEKYTPALPDGAWTDDDTDIEWIYILEMQRSKTLLLTPGRIAELWQRHINRRIWCSHQYLRQLLDLGIEPPLTGRVQLNPWADFNLSGQFASETWGLISPGMPQTAARTGLHYTHVSIDAEPAQATQLFASMIASAFLVSDIDKLLDGGLAAMDPRSRLRQAVLDVRGWHREYPQDWRATRARIRKKYTLYADDDMRDKNGVLLNGAATVAALLYGRGDFVETVRHAFNFGWDCDNNAATSGTILGVIKGERWMKNQGWQIADRFRNTSRDDVPEDETITRFGDRLIELARLAISTGKARVEQPANVEPLPDIPQQTASLRAELRPLVEADLAAADTRNRARAAYLAIALDLAPELRRAHPGQWPQALAALRGYPKVMRVLFFESPVPAGDRLREKAIAAGLERPAKKTKLW